MSWAEYLHAIVLGGIECLAPSERFRRDLVGAFQDARVLEDERVWISLPPEPGPQHLVASPAEVRAFVRTSWSYVQPTVRDSLRATTMVLLGAADGEERRVQARALCARLVSTLLVEQPLAGWLGQP